MLTDQLDRLDDNDGSLDVSSRDDSNTGTGTRSDSKLDSSFSNTGNTPQSAEVELVASKVSKQVFWLKLTVVAVLVFAAAVVATVIFITTSRAEVNSFEVTFKDDATKVFDTFTFNVERKLSAIDALSVAITSLATDSNAQWPNFTVPNFDYRAANARELADAASIALLPLVDADTRAGWEAYSVQNTQWIEESQRFSESVGQIERKLQPTVNVNGISKDIFELSDDGEATIDGTPGPYFPIWQHYPTIPNIVNYDLWLNDNFHNGILAMMESKNAVIGEIWDLQETNDIFVEFLEAWESDSGLRRDDPVSKLFYPVFDTFDEDHAIVAMLASVINWGKYFDFILPPHARGVIVVLSNACGDTYTYEIIGESAKLLGRGDFHDDRYDYLEERATFAELISSDTRVIERYTDVDLNHDYCAWTLQVYPSKVLEDEFVTSNSILYTVGVVAVFVFTGIIFFLYDYIVERRQKMVMKRAVQSRAIVSSLFPAAVRDRLFRTDDARNKDDKGFRKKGAATSNANNLMADNNIQEQNPNNELRPIADLFPHTTVMFADIVGFTRWSSERDPAHVFTLLQSLYHAFDALAKKRGVFKVETIGDCYVAVTGLPDPQADHAIRMAKFASECKNKMSSLVSKLKKSLGEDTGDLCMRFGLHSGPVTAGVLRGEKSRFQLFGSTVNTSAQMEKTGQKKKIQVSQETADLITNGGKGHWIFQRIDDVAARGGIQTYWCEPQTTAQEAKIKNAAPTRVVAKGVATPVDSSQRLINWNVDLFKRMLKCIAADRADRNVRQDQGQNFTLNRSRGATVRDEILETAAVPKFNRARTKTDPKTIQLSEKVEEQLLSFVSQVESMYHDNQFHSFKHASNVCTNAHRLLSSIVDEKIGLRTNDPLTQFAVVFSALIHDIDHLGLTNMLLVKEQPHLADRYKNKSVAEQNSVDLAWNMLLEPQYAALQEAIYSTPAEFKRFRDLVVNIVMATDIFDRELNHDRNSRWGKAFGPTHTRGLSSEMKEQLQANVVLEQIMQVADIMHTMQHFSSYQAWNERLFKEMYAAFQNGKTSKDPSIDWYQGEIWFFDNCVIPLAQRVNDSGVFGAQGKDCLYHAIANKKEWAVKGGDIVQSQIEKVVERSNPMEMVEDADEEEKQEQAPSRPDSLRNCREDSECESATPSSLAENKNVDHDNRLIEWNVDMFKRLLRQLVAFRLADETSRTAQARSLVHTMKEGSTVREELVRILNFPQSDHQIVVDPETIELHERVQDQLRDYVTFIAAMYRKNPFHNFARASNVAMASNRYIQRIVDGTLEKQLKHPLTQFGIVFASLIHDVDHSGVPNSQMVKEGSRMAVVYQNRSVGEQNSLDLAWSVLMDSEYKDLQKIIYRTKEELASFRQILVNAVMATDMDDAALHKDRQERWNLAFNATTTKQKLKNRLSSRQKQNLETTVIMEHMIQAADIGHTLQPFHTFRRWSERMFCEKYAAFDSGRSDRDPSLSWYQDEMAYLDEVAIPLAQKLVNCNKFGQTAVEALDCAQTNRKDWALQGPKLVAKLKNSYLERKREEEKNNY